MMQFVRLNPNQINSNTNYQFVPFNATQVNMPQMGSIFSPMNAVNVNSFGGTNFMFNFTMILSMLSKMFNAQPAMNFNPFSNALNNNFIPQNNVAQLQTQQYQQTQTKNYSQANAQPQVNFGSVTANKTQASKNVSHAAVSTSNSQQTTSSQRPIEAKAQNAVMLAEQEYKKGVKELTGNDDGAEIDKYRKGAKSGAWCASFVSWIYGDGQNSNNDETFKYTASSSSMANRAKKAGFFVKRGEGYIPQVGDVAVYLIEDNNLRNAKVGPSNHVGIVTEVSEDGSEITIISGNSGNKVAKKIFNEKNNTYTGYIRMNDWLASQG